LVGAIKECENCQKCLDCPDHKFGKKQNLAKKGFQGNRDKLALMAKGDLGSMYPKRAVKKDDLSHVL